MKKPGTPFPSLEWVCAGENLFHAFTRVRILHARILARRSKETFFSDPQWYPEFGYA